MTRDEVIQAARTLAEKKGWPVCFHYHTISGEPLAHHVYVQEPYAPQH